MPSPEHPRQPKPINTSSDVEKTIIGEMQPATEREQTEAPKSAVLRTITHTQTQAAEQHPQKEHGSSSYVFERG